MTEDASTSQEESSPRWQPLASIDRRVAGVLAEKAKTTSDAYPMSLNAICAASNQKSNRAPLMQLQPDDVEESLDRLRELGAVGIVQGQGRVSKYRHYLYDWLGVDKVEMAVITELLLRGAQTVGELRGRAARMEPITSLSELRPVLASLESKGLVVALTPEGRGQVVGHALYQPGELETLKAQYSQDPAPITAAAAEVRPGPVPSTAPTDVHSEIDPEFVELVRRQMTEFRSQIAQLRSDVDDLSTQLQETDNDLRDLKESLGG